MANAQDFTDEEIAGFNAHNNYRSIHCVPPLGFNVDALAAARNWAANSPQGTDAQGHITFGHDPNRAPYGENLAWGTGLTAAQAVALWYGENTLYDYNSPGFSPATGHFTQLVWLSSTGVGMAMATRGGVNLWVARYFPAGNITGQFASNVFPPLSGPLCAGLFRTAKAIGTVPPAPEELGTGHKAGEN